MRTSYGLLAFKIPHPEGTSEAEMVIVTRKATKAATDALEAHGAQPTTMEKVFEVSQADPERMIGKLIVPGNGDKWDEPGEEEV